MTTPSSRLLAVTAVLVIPAVAGCSTNFGAQTDQVYIPTRGTNDRSGSVNVLNTLVVSDDDGTGTVVATLVNNQPEPDQLTGVTVEAAPAQIARGAEVAAIPARGHNNLAESGAVTAEADGIVAGEFVELTFTFENAEAVTISAPVVTPEGDYEDVPLPGTQ